MSRLTTRLLGSLRSSMLLSSRFYSKKEISKVDHIEIAYSHKKEELMEIQEAENDPFQMKAIKRRSSTKKDPIPIYSYYNSRIVGCVCEEDSSEINWFWLHEGEPKRCYCGHWFKLQKFVP